MFIYGNMFDVNIFSSLILGQTTRHTEKSLYYDSEADETHEREIIARDWTLNACDSGRQEKLGT